MGHNVRYEIDLTDFDKKKEPELMAFIKEKGFTDSEIDGSEDEIVVLGYHSYTFNLGEAIVNSKKFKDLSIRYWDLDVEAEIFECESSEWDGTEGQDRESYSDTQDRESYGGKENVKL